MSANQDTSKKVDILINGHSYSINCPVNDEDTLKRSAKYIHQFIQDIRRQSPQLSQEKLLVLCALNLYAQAEKCRQYQDIETQASTMVEKMLQELQNIKHPSQD